MGQTFYKNDHELERFIEDTRVGFIVVGYQNLSNYPGMVLFQGIHFNTESSSYQLALEWIALGLDLYGDTLQETYQYKFKSLSSLLEYLHSMYSIRVTDIMHDYYFDASRFPDPIKDQDKRILYEEAWNRFQKDFRDQLFLDSTLELTYSSIPKDQE